MKTHYNFRTVTALIIRAVGLVCVTVGAVFIFRWLLIELTPGRNSGPVQYYAWVGFPCALFGLACRWSAAWLLR